MSRFNSSLLSGFAAIALCVGVASAQPRTGMQAGPHRLELHQQFMEELDLSSEQKEKIQGIRLEARKQRIAHHAKLQLAQLELHELIEADTPDQKKIDVKIAELSKLRETAMRDRITTHLEVQKILTPEQRKKAKDLRPFRGDHGFDGFHGGAGMRRGLGPWGNPGMRPFED